MQIRPSIPVTVPIDIPIRKLISHAALQLSAEAARAEAALLSKPQLAEEVFVRINRFPERGVPDSPLND